MEPDLVEARGVACSAVKLMVDVVGTSDDEQTGAQMDELNVLVSSYLAAPLEMVTEADIRTASESLARAHALIIQIGGVAGLAASLLRQRGIPDEWLVQYEMSLFKSGN